jgi:predicted transcriptional regulator
MINQNKNNKVERFEYAFNRIHSRLKELSQANNSDRFVDLLQDNKEKYSAIRFNFHKLKQYAKLRNAIVHEKIEDGFYIAEPHLSVVEEIEKISEDVYHPPSVYSLANKPVIYLKSHTPLTKILSLFAKYEYSQYPVYENGHFKGLLTSGGITKWLSNVEGGVHKINDTKAEDVLKFEKRRNVACLAKNANMYDMENVFHQFYENKQKLEAVLITEDGDQDQLPLGIVTSWDLLQIDHTTSSLRQNT